MRKPRNIFQRDIFIETRPPEQYNSEFRTEQKQQMGDFVGCIVVFDDIVDYNQKATDKIFARCKHETLVV